MDLTPKTLLAYGYFPSEELPPPFNTFKLGKEIIRIGPLVSSLSNDFLKKHSTSQSVNYSVPKKEFSRRNLKIPNPLHFISLINSIFKNGNEIEAILKSSNYSVFLKPNLWKDWEEFKKVRFIASQEHIYELKTDISRYFPTIYTHVIPWVVHGKKQAKAAKRNMNLWGNVIDKNLRDLEDGQTMGIPVGPHVSRIIAELIGCEIDARLERQFSINGINTQAFRYVDDYFFYFSDEATGEEILKILQNILYELNWKLIKKKLRYPNFLSVLIWSLSGLLV